MHAHHVIGSSNMQTMPGTAWVHRVCVGISCMHKNSSMPGRVYGLGSRNV